MPIFVRSADCRFRLLGAAVAILAGCGGSQAQMAAPSVVSPAASHVRTASTSGSCPALPGGTGILTDGDFSQAPDPGSEQGLPAGTKFAPDWVVERERTHRLLRLRRFVGRAARVLCSVDFDGSGTEGVVTGAIRHGRVRTTVDAMLP